MPGSFKSPRLLLSARLEYGQDMWQFFDLAFENLVTNFLWLHLRDIGQLLKVIG